MIKSKIISGKVIAIESGITTFKNKDSYNALCEKVVLFLTLDNNKSYQIDSPPEGVEIGSKVNLYYDNGTNTVIIDNMTAKYIKRQRVWEMLPNYIVLIGGGIGSILLLIALIINSIKDGLNYNILDTFLSSSFLTLYSFTIGKKTADKVVNPEDLKKIDVLLKEDVENESFISPEDIEKLKSTHKEKVNIWKTPEKF